MLIISGFLQDFGDDLRMEFPQRTSLFAGKVGVMIIDMQELFLRYLIENPSQDFKNLINTNRELLDWAHKYQAPVVLIESEGHGKTIDLLLTRFEQLPQNQKLIVNKTDMSAFIAERNMIIPAEIESRGIELLLGAGVQKFQCVARSVYEIIDKSNLGIILPNNSHANATDCVTQFKNLAALVRYSRIYKNLPDTRFFADLGNVSSCLGLIDAARISPEAFEAYKARILAQNQALASA